MNLTLKDIDWKSYLIKNYINYQLDELDCMVIFICDSILDIEENILIQTDNLVPYMKASREDIDKSLSKLVNSHVLECVVNSKSIRSSLTNFKNKLFNDMIKDISLKNSIGGNATLDEDLYSFIEDKAGSISSLDKDLVSSWLKIGATSDMIKEAITRSINKNGRVSFKKADTVILELLRSKSRVDIGVSTVNEDRRNDNSELKELIRDSKWD